MSCKVMLWAVQLKVPVSHASARVLMVLASYADDQGCNAYPSLDTIALMTQANRSTVVRCLAQLETDGIVTRQSGGGRAKSNRYNINLAISAKAETGASGDGLSADTVAPCAGFDPDTVAPRTCKEVETGAPRNPSNTVNSGIKRLNGAKTPSKHPVNSCMVQPDSKEVSKKAKGELRSRTLSRAAKSDAGFAEFYAAYPKKRSPDEALKAWSRLVRHGEPAEVIMAGLARHRFTNDFQFIPYPASWLNDGSYKDFAEPEPERLPSNVHRIRPETRSEERTRLLAEMERDEQDRAADARMTIDGEAIHG